MESRDPMSAIARNLNPQTCSRHAPSRAFFSGCCRLGCPQGRRQTLLRLLDRKVSDLLLVAQDTAIANGRDKVELWDLPITKGLQESIRAFETLDTEVGLEPILEKAAPRPLLDPSYSEETEARSPAIAGGLSVALARTFKVIDSHLKNPATEHWERAFQMFDQLL
jgi:Domain of unknown function (DUF1931)